MASAPPDQVPGLSARDLVGDRQLGLALTLVAGASGLGRRIGHARIQKSGLVLVGHVHGVVPDRIQILGETEFSYLEGLSPAAQASAVRHLFQLRPALVLVTRGARVPEPLVTEAESADTPLAVCAADTSTAIAALHTRLDERLAPRTRIHGVLVDVFEVGVLLLGRSGIGKSECALDLVRRGHRLVADDAIECDYRPPGMVFGEAPPLLRHHIEVRGLGILDVKELFGITAIRERKRIDLVVRMVEGAEEAGIDRLGLDACTRTVLGVPIREVVLLVQPGRDTASILEMAARNELLRSTGRNSSLELVQRVDQALVRRPGESGMLPALAAVAPARGSSLPVRPPESSVPGAAPGEGGRPT